MCCIIQGESPVSASQNVHMYNIHGQNLSLYASAETRTDFSWQGKKVMSHPTSKSRDGARTTYDIGTGIWMRLPFFFFFFVSALHEAESHHFTSR